MFWRIALVCANKAFKFRHTYLFMKYSISHDQDQEMVAKVKLNINFERSSNLFISNYAFNLTCLIK
jgi:hypothetical protein